MVDLKAVDNDLDHVIAVFKQYGYWGAISKTNHAVLRYREPIYKNIRELVLSFFHEYHCRGKKNLRSYSQPANLARFDKQNWMGSETDLWYIDEYLDKTPHKNILTKQMIKNLRQADSLEIKAGELTQWKEWKK